MPYNFAADSFHTNKLVVDFLQAKCDFRRKSAVLFLSPLPFGSLRATYDDHLKLISVNWTFSLGVTAEALRANIGSKSAISLQRGPVNPKLGWLNLRGGADLRIRFSSSVIGQS